MFSQPTLLLEEMNVSFPVILLFWALSLSPVWLNIEGWQDFSYKTQILFFYSENNSNSLNRPLNTNLIVVQWAETSYGGYLYVSVLKASFICI